MAEISFCSSIKNELSEIKTKNCCRNAMIYGFALFGRSFSVKRIALQTENEKTAYCYAGLLKRIYGADACVSCGGGKRPTYVVSVPSEGDRLKILATVDFGIGDNIINREIIRKDCCVGCFIRGAFLACGHLADPDKCYRLDFSVKNESLANELSSLLYEHGIEMHLSKRGGAYTVYTKKSETISYLLALVGASARSLEMMETSILKSVKNAQNRGRNCDSANIKKTVEASLSQRRAIAYLKKNAYLEALPDELVCAAELRERYPEASLKELCSLSNEAITVSGLNHRLQKIMKIYNEIKLRKSGN